MKTCSVARGCTRKTILGRDFKTYADLLATEHEKQYGVYRCPHCGNAHLTTKLHKQDEYPPLLYVTPSNEKTAQKDGLLDVT